MRVPDAAMPQGMEKKVLGEKARAFQYKVGKQEFEVLALDGSCSLFAFCSILSFLITVMNTFDYLPCAWCSGKSLPVFV